MNKIFRRILLACFAVGSVWAQNEPYALGADISWIPEREASGVKYAHNGQVKDILDILKEHKFNYIRLRLFVDPTVGVPEDTAKALADAKGGTPWYASPYSKAGYCGLNSTIEMAKRVKNAGMKFLLDFHYSDTWADPGKQFKPMSWRGLDFTQLTEKVRSYTKESLEKFRENGVLPDMVQVGNEVINGMIHPNGSTSNWSNFATLVNAGINGVRDVDPNIKIMMHTVSEKNPNNWLTTLKTRLNQVEANAANKVNVIGLSYYPEWHGDLNVLRQILNDIANNHNIKIAVVEYADKHREVNDLVFALPENKRFGTFVWEPEEFSGDNSLPLFDWKNGRRETNSRISLYPQMSIDYNIAEPTVSSSSSVKPSSSSATPSSSSTAPSSSSVTPSSSSSGTTPIRLPNIATSNRAVQIHNGINLQVMNNATVEVYNLSGNLINRQNFGSGTYSVSFAHLPKGMYIAKISYTPLHASKPAIIILPNK